MKQEKQHKIILDCDPGHDDAIAIILAFSASNIEVLGITLTGGNQTLAKTVQNAKNIVEFIQVKTPVVAGRNSPLFRVLEIADSVHGESGLDGPELPFSKQKTHDLDAVDFIAEQALNQEEPITLVATGPLTNIGLFLLSYPHLKDRIKEIVIMGGAMVGGNWSPGAEFNILVDPEAAKIVFDSGIPIVMAGLDVTEVALMYPENIEALRKIPSPTAVLVAELLDFFILFHLELGFEGAPLHDPCTIAYLMNPDMFDYLEAYVDIEIDGEFTTGATVVDQFGVLNKPKNTKVLTNVDQVAFFNLIKESMRFYQERGL